MIKNKGASSPLSHPLNNIHHFYHYRRCYHVYTLVIQHVGQPYKVFICFHNGVSLSSTFTNFSLDIPVVVTARAKEHLVHREQLSPYLPGQVRHVLSTGF